MARVDKGERNRILLAMDHFGMSPAAMAGVIGLAARLDAIVEGLFVEDADLLRVAELPFAIEIAAASGAERPITRTAVEQAFLASSARARRLLAESANRSNVRWSFATAGGERVVAALRASEHSDLLFPGRMAGALTAPGQRALDDVFPRRVAMVLDASGQAERAAAIVAALGQNGHTREVLLLGDRAPPAELVRVLSGSGVRVLHALAPAAELFGLLEALRESPANLLIAPKRLLVETTPASRGRALGMLTGALLLLR